MTQAPQHFDREPTQLPAEKPRAPAANESGPSPDDSSPQPVDPALDVGRPPITRAGVTLLADAALPTRYGVFRIAILRVDQNCAEAVLLTHGTIDDDQPLLVRLQSECLTGDVFGSLRCDCGAQLDAAIARIGAAGRGALIYLRQEGRGIGLANKIRAYALQDRGLDTVDANLALGLPVDGRDYAPAAAVLHYLGVRQVRLLTNNPAKGRALERHDLTVVERIPLEITATPLNRTYLRTKAERLGHTFKTKVAEVEDQ